VGGNNYSELVLFISNHFSILIKGEGRTTTTTTTTTKDLLQRFNFPITHIETF